MDRRAFLTTMLKGALATTLLPHSISPFLVAQYASPHYLAEIPQYKIQIAALGVGRFGANCSRLLAKSVHNISYHQVPSSSRLHIGCIDFPRLPPSFLQADLLFLFADANELPSEYLLTSCMDAAAMGMQTVVIGPSIDASIDATLSLFTPGDSPISVCMIADPATVYSMVALVVDLVNTYNFVGIDQADVEAILWSGSRGLFACSEVTGADMGSRACSKALEQLQQQGLDSASRRGAIACIYGSLDLSFEHYHQAITSLDSQFFPDINFVFGAVADERLTDSVRVTILAMR